MTREYRTLKGARSRVRETVSELLLVDTHVWIWMVEGQTRELGRSIRRTLDLAVGDGRAIISAISVWELGLLVAKRRVTLTRELPEWVAGTRLPPGFRMVDVTAEMAIESMRLPGRFHADPADRFLVATARLLSATLVTRDERILEYARAGHLRVLDASR